MKIFLLVAFALGVVAGASDDCKFDPQEACDHCPWDRNYVYFVADECNCTIFYLCEKRSDGVIIPHEQYCNPCFCFSNDLWTCSNRTDYDPCPTIVPATDPAPTVPSNRNYFCVDFDNDYREQRVYYDVEPTCSITAVSELDPQNNIYFSGLKMEKKALLSGGNPCNIEIPYFKNNQFTQFTFCGLFIFYEDLSGNALGFIFNGYEDDCYPGSIKLLLTADRKVQGEVHTIGGTFQITSETAVSAYQPHKVCFRYDGSKRVKSLQLVIDGSLETKKSFTKAASGLTVRQKCNLRLGEVLERNSDNKNYTSRNFVGILDTWCFSPSIVDESYFTAP